MVGVGGYFAFARGTGHDHHPGGGHFPSRGRMRNTHHHPPSRCRPASSGAGVVVVILLLPIRVRAIPHEPLSGFLECSPGFLVLSACVRVPALVGGLLCHTYCKEARSSDVLVNLSVISVLIGERGEREGRLSLRVSSEASVSLGEGELGEHTHWTIFS